MPKSWLAKQGRAISAGVNPISDTPTPGVRPSRATAPEADAGPSGVGPSTRTAAPGMFSHLKLGPAHNYMGHFLQPKFLMAGHNDVPSVPIGDGAWRPGRAPDAPINGAPPTAPPVSGPSTPAQPPTVAAPAPAPRPSGANRRGALGALAGALGTTRNVARDVGLHRGGRANRIVASGAQVNAALNPVLAAKVARRTAVLNAAAGGGGRAAIRAVRQQAKGTIREARQLRRTENKGVGASIANALGTATGGQRKAARQARRATIAASRRPLR